MSLAANLPRLLAHPALAALLVVAVVALPLAGVVACPVEEYATGDTDDVREVEFTVAANASDAPVPRARRAAHASHPPAHARQLPSHPPPDRPSAVPLSSPLRC